MRGSAVVTTRLSRVTMNSAAETRTSVQPARARVLDIVLLRSNLLIDLSVLMAKKHNRPQAAAGSHSSAGSAISGKPRAVVTLISIPQAKKLETSAAEAPLTRITSS